MFWLRRILLRKVESSMFLLTFILNLRTMKPNRKDQLFSPEFAKDVVYEQILESLNRNLLAADKAFLRSGLDEEYSTIHIFGVPRSGTTLVNQYLASALDVGY